MQTAIRRTNRIAGKKSLRIFSLVHDLSQPFARLLDQRVKRIVGDAHNAAFMTVVDEKSGGLYIDDRTRTACERQAFVFIDFFDFAIFASARQIPHRNFGKRDYLRAACRLYRLADDRVYIDDARKLFCSFFQEAVDFLFFIHFKKSSIIFFVSAIPRTRMFMAAEIRMLPFRQAL